MSGNKHKENTQDIEAVLHYIDKLFTSHRELANANNRIFLITTMLAVVLLALSGGAVSAEGKLAVAGVGLRVPLAVFLTGAALLLSIVAATRISAQWQEDRIQREIKRLYRSIGFYDRTMDGIIASPFRTSNAIYLILDSFRNEPYERPPSKSAEGPWFWLYNFHMGLYWFFALILPLAAEIGTGFKVAELLRERGFGWIWTLFIIVALAIGAITWAVRMRPIFQQREEDSTRGLNPYAWWYAAELFCMILASGAIGYFVAEVLGSS